MNEGRGLIERNQGGGIEWKSKRMTQASASDREATVGEDIVFGKDYWGTIGGNRAVEDAVRWRNREAIDHRIGMVTEGGSREGTVWGAQSR